MNRFRDIPNPARVPARLLAALTVLLLWCTTASAVTNIPVCTAQYDQFLPRIVASGAGGEIVSWVDFRAGDYDIYAQQLDMLGNPLWGTQGVPVSKAVGIQSNVQMVPDGAGGAFIVWQDARGGAGAGDDIYVQRVNAAGVPVWFPDGVPVTTASGIQESPRIVPDGSGGIVIAWADNHYGDFDIWAQRLDASGTLMWATNGVPLCTAIGDEREVTLVPDGLGGAIAAWRDDRNGPDVYAQRVNGLGTPQWTADGVVVSAAASDQRTPLATADGAGGIIVTWSDLRNGNWDVYAQRMNASGVAQWTANGVVVCNATLDQTVPKLCYDGAGGAIITWQDLRGGTTNDIYAQRITSAGAAQWTANGVAVCNATLDQLAPEISRDPNGGGVIVWVDNRTAQNGLDIYAQHINGSGAVQWTANGVAMCNTSGAQDQPMVVTDGQGGAGLAWRDYRSTVDTDIYSVQVDGNGSVVGQCPATATALVSDTPVSTSAVQTYYDVPIDDLYWSALGVRSASGSDHDIEIYAPGTLGLGTYPTCFLYPFGGSYASTGVDFVVGNFNDTHTPVDTYGARVTRYGGSGTGTVEWDFLATLIETDCTGSTCGAVRSSSWTGVLDTYDVYLAGGQTYTFTFTHTGSADIRVLLFGSGNTVGNYIVPRSARLFETTDKYHVFTSPKDDFYGLVLVNENGLSGTYQVKVDSTAIVGVGDTPLSATRLTSISPNPTAGSSLIQFTLGEPGDVSFRVIDMAGRVAGEIAEQRRGRGSWSVRWDGKGRDGRALPAGVYFVQMSLNGQRVGLSRLALIH